MTGQRKKRIAGSYFVSTLSISLVLVVVGILVFILLNAKLVSDHVKQNIGFSIIVKDNVNEAEIKKMQKILDTKPFVSSSVFISKVEAAREFKEELGEDFEGVLGYNPLLPSVEIKLNPVYANNDSLTVIEKSLLKNELVQEVSYQKSLVHMINENVRRISLILLIAGAALMLISFTLIRNTIHLSDLILLAAIFFLQKEVGSVVNLMNKELIIIMVAFVMVCGILLSLVSSWMSVARYLNKDMNDLYN